MILSILILFLFFPAKVFAANTVSILDYPTQVFLDETFPVVFNVTSTDIGGTFHYKAVSDSDISIFPACASRYDDCDTLIIGDSLIATASAYLKINQAQAKNSIKVRIANHFKHQQTFDSNSVDIFSLAMPTILPTPTTIIRYPQITEIMTNPSDGQEWVEFYNPHDQVLSLKDICIFDSSQNKKCLPDHVDLGPGQYYQFVFSGSFLNNSGDSVIFNQQTIDCPKSPKNLSYSLQNNGYWCFSQPSPGALNTECEDPLNDIKKEETPLPLLNIIFIPEKIRAGEDFNISLSLNSAELYSIRLVHPFSSPYFAFANYQNAFAIANLTLSSSQKLPEGKYPLLFHLKKTGSTKTYDYQQGTLEILPFIKKVKTKTTSLTKNSPPLCPVLTPAVLGTHSASHRSSIFTPSLPDFNTFSWLFLFAGSILFLSPILFPKLYSD